MPNREGILLFIRDVWPRIKRDVPNVHLRLVGKGSEEVPNLCPDIEGLGWMDDASEEIASWSAMIVPIHVGGGTRIKIAEAFSRKCPVISTSLGAYGYDLESGREAMLADNPSAFAQACIDLITNAPLRESLTAHAYKRYQHHWTWEAQANSVARAVEHCLERQNM